jgi:tRNA (cmo5U34)-methyltransferase
MLAHILPSLHDYHSQNLSKRSILRSPPTIERPVDDLVSDVSDELSPVAGRKYDYERQGHPPYACNEPSTAHNANVLPNEWTIPERVVRYLDRADAFPHRLEGESVLLEQIPAGARRVLDLGTGDGRLLALLQRDHPEIDGVGLDFSEVMLDAARKRFDGDRRIEFVQHNLIEPLPMLGRFDAIVSSFAIHHLEHDRKRFLYGEVFELLEPGGVFANFEHVASPTDRLHLAFFKAINEPIDNEDPSDRTLDVHTQLEWLRALGFDDVDCYWKWLEMALLVGVKPPPDALPG